MKLTICEEIESTTLTAEQKAKGWRSYKAVEVDKSYEELKAMGWFSRPSYNEFPFDPSSLDVTLPDQSGSKELEEVKSAQPDPSSSEVSNLDCQPEQMEIDDEERDKRLTEFCYYLDIENETFLYHHFRHDDVTVPAHSDNDDDLFQQQLHKAQVPRIKQFENPIEMNDPIVTAVASKLLEVEYLWVSLREQCNAVNKTETFDNTIIAAAKLVCSLYTKEYLYRIGCVRDKRLQMKQLWDSLGVVGREGGSLSEAYKEIVKLVADENKYYLVTESDIGYLLTDYMCGRCQRYSKYDEDRSIKREQGLVNDIKKLVQQLPFQIKSEDDENTRFLIKLLRGVYSQEENLIMGLLAESNIKDENTTFMTIVFAIMMAFVPSAKTDMKDQLTTLIHPVYSLYNPSDLPVSSRVFEMVQVAELRRIALGRRFIGRSHLIWAFYECGYGLPPMITKKIKLNSDQDCPSYHIYAAAIKLAGRAGDKNMRLEHLIYAVLYLEDICVDWDKGIEYQNHFSKVAGNKNMHLEHFIHAVLYLEDICIDWGKEDGFLKRFRKFKIDLQRSSASSSSDIRDVEEGPLKKLRSADLSEVNECMPSVTKQMPSSSDMVVTRWD